MHVRWDHGAQATPHGQIVYFAEFLDTAGIFDNWVKNCPLHYTSPNASSVRDVLGTLMLGVLSGSKRYAHLAGIRGDQVAAQALGLNKIVSQDSVRRALSAMKPEAAQQWMQQALRDSVIQALDRSWVLDLDTTIKSLYGHQEGAQIGYNPRKPGRPSHHALHTYWVGNLRLVLDMELRSGKEHSSGHGKVGLAKLLDDLGERAPAMVNPQARREALTSRPLLLAAVGRATHSGGRTELHLTPMHAQVGLIKTMIANIQAAIAYVRRAAQQLSKVDRRCLLLGYISEQITRQTVLPTPPTALAGAG